MESNVLALTLSGALHGLLLVSVTLMWQGHFTSFRAVQVELVEPGSPSPLPEPRLIPPRPEPVRPVAPRPLPRHEQAPPRREPPVAIKQAETPPIPPERSERPMTTTPAPEIPAATPGVDASAASPREPAPAASSDAMETFAAPPAPAAPSTPRTERPGLPGPVVAAVPPSAPAGGPVTRGARPRGGYESQPRPEYPGEARRAKAQGTTLLRVHVTSGGSVDQVEVERSAGHASLDQSAAQTVSRWRFEPATNAAGPVAVWVVIPVNFTLRNE
jgi:periplasmic protein TonB